MYVCSSTPRTKPLSSVSKTSEYSLSHFPNNLSANRQISSLSPRVSNVRGAHIPSPGLPNMQYYMGHPPSYPPPEDKFSVRSVSSSTEEPAAAAAGSFSMTYNDDNIDNSSEKPVDYSQMYQESSGYERQASVSHNADAAASFNTSLPRPVGQLPSALLHHDPAVLLQTSSGSFLDPSYFHAPIPTLSEIKAQAMVEKARDSAAIRAPPNGPRAMTDLSRIEDHHGEDQVRTFCTEGTPMNFLSTATSMNEINKIGEEPIPEQDEPTSLSQTNKSVSSQGNTTHSAMLGTHLPKEGSLPSALKPSLVPRPTLPEVEDEAPRTYATEDTPITGISRVSSLSSLTR
ncbi:hypothetical protein EB796_024195 [Bugula neritina]|uniref:Uncharacterized protein n=1 Tax=Bugula neritina TaxID=10212 RepID=A0A7J7IU78_BUGNE|nr:hypothetical protein EB796_024195 [Bugula neritina]